MLALLFNEPGAEAVAASIDGAYISPVNLAEVLEKRLPHADPDTVAADLAHLGLLVAPVTAQQAAVAARLKTIQVKGGFSLGDRFCIALGLELSAKIYTADRVWNGLPHGADIRLVR